MTGDELRLRAFYLVSYVYLAYLLAVGSRAAWASARVTAAPLSIGLRIMAVALAGKLVGGPLIRLPTVVAGAAGHTFPVWVDAGAAVLVRASIVLFLLGVVFPLVAGRVLAVARWSRNRRALHELGPLWTLLHDAFPQDELRRGRRSSMRGRCYRRAVECRDGLVRLSPHWPPDGPGRSPAQQLRSALRAHANGEAPLGPARLVVPPRAPGVDGDVAALVALSRQLARQAAAQSPA